MKKMLPLLTLGLCLGFGLAHADEKKAPTPQQQRMTQCNKDATGKTGDERKAFMSECLKAKPEAAAKGTAQQERMKKCNADATGKTGDERKKFMSQCLSNK